MHNRSPNSEQQASIDHVLGASLIIAGAGTGKTYVLIEKIKKFLLEKKAQPQEVLALTFTEKAAQEMQERVDEALPYGYYQMWIMTFHSFADTLLREQGVHIGINPAFKILTEIEGISFFRRNLNKFEIKYFHSTGNPNGFIKGALEHFSRLRDENISPESYVKFAQKKKKSAQTDEEIEEAEKIGELASLYSRYSAIKLEHNYLDFSDLLYYLVFLLKKRPHIRKLLQKQFKYCLVDEFQDTNYAQYDLIKLLFPPENNPNLAVIGDDNQSIYKFRGASVSNILNFIKDYPSAKTFILNVNYRSYQEILDVSYKLISNNNPDTLESRLGISKKLIASRGSTKRAVELLCGYTGEEEAESVVRKIKELVDKKKYAFRDCAILVRGRSHAQPIIQAFERSTIPFQFLGPNLLYFKSEIRDLIALFKFLTDPTDSISLYRVLAMSLFKLSNKDIQLLVVSAKRTGRSLFEIIEILLGTGQSTDALVVKNKLPFFGQELKQNLEAVYRLLLYLLEKSPEEASALKILYEFLQRSGYLKLLSTITSVREEERLSNITRFFNKLKKMEGEFGEPTIREAVDAINLSLELGDSPLSEDIDMSTNDAVNILTVHSSKGLEFPVVFLVSLTSDRFPSREQAEKLPIPVELIREVLPSGNAYVQEERRLFYVGLTRAQDRLFVSFAQFYLSGKRKKKVSPFIVEALGEEVLAGVLSRSDALNKQLSIFDFVLKKEETVESQRTSTGFLPERLSYSQIESFERCPKQYQFRYLMKIPEPDSSALSYGSSAHKALELLYRDVQLGRVATKEMLLAYFKSNFSPFGFATTDARKKAYDRGSTALATYYDKFHKDGEVIAVEQSFVCKLSQGEHTISISGKIDRIDKKGSIYEIVDYKTGKVPDESKLKNSPQLGIYALAAMDPALLGALQENIRLTFYYLDAGEKYTIEASVRDLEKVKAGLFKTISEFETTTFEPKPEAHKCEWCPFKIICPAWDN